MSYQTKVRANYLNRTSKLAFYAARNRKGDVTRLAEATGYSTSHISNVLAGRRSVPQELANEMYRISSRRMKNSEKAIA
jgi:Ethanolamine utilization protein EutJ (predicted chaperonin)